MQLIQSWEDYLKVYAESIQNPDLFWDGVAQACLSWHKPWTQVSDWDYRTGKVRWFPGAELNVTENCLDRHLLAGKGDQLALIWVGNEPEEERRYTYRELHGEVCRMARALESLGLRKGERVVMYLPNVPELAISVLACARIGAIHSVVFGGFSAASLQSRVNDCGAKLILAADGTFRGKKWIDLKVNVDEAMALGCPTVERVVVLMRDRSTGQGGAELKNYEITWDELVHSGLPANHPAPPHDSLDPLFILYTSGSTGKPKGVMHAMGGYLTYVTYTFQTVFQPKPEDVFWCTADLGWITGHSYLLYGPLASGVTTVMFEGVPTYPNPGRFWQVVDRLGVSIFYTSPTAIRVLAGAGNEFVKMSKRNSLRTLGTVGEPIGPEAWKWYQSVVGEDRVSVVDTWWQTETGGILISPIAGVSPTQPGSASLPLPGIEPEILDEKTRKPMGGIESGALVIKRSWPGQMIGVYGDPDRFRDTYLTRFPGTYFTGDAAHRDAEGLYWITGRMDDVIKVSGHRLGTAEIEAACLTYPELLESAAVGIPDPLTGEAIQIFAVPKNWDTCSSKTLAWTQELVKTVRHQVGSLATPQKIYWVPGLPKTRSGKIMRRLLKKMANGEFENLGDTSTLAEPTVVQEIISALRRSDSV